MMLLNEKGSIDLTISISLKHFFIRFLLWIVGLQLLVIMINQTPIMIDTIVNTIAFCSSIVYSTAVEPMTLSENLLIHSDSGRFLVIDAQSTALSLTATMAAALFSTEFPWRQKLIAVMVAALLIQLQNFVRISHLFNEIKQANNNFEFLNLYVWQFANFISALILFLLLFHWLQNSNKKSYKQ